MQKRDFPEDASGILAFQDFWEQAARCKSRTPAAFSWVECFDGVGVSDGSGADSNSRINALAAEEKIVLPFV